MSTFAEKLMEQSRISTHAFYIGERAAFKAGAVAALRLAAEALDHHDTHRYIGKENIAYNSAMDFCGEQLRTLASTIEGGT